MASERESVLPRLDRLRDLIESETASGAIVGAQIHVRLGGGPAFDLACGLARADKELTTDTLVPWFSAGKIVTAIAAMRLAEEGRLPLDAPIAEWLPQFRRPVHDTVTARHLLSHSSGILDRGRLPTGPPSEVIDGAAADDGRYDWPPGAHSAYSRYTEWYVLSGLLESVAERPFQEVIDDTLRAIGVSRTTFGMSEEMYRERAEDITHIYQTAGNVGWVHLPAMRKEACRCDRAGNGLGSMRDLVKIMTAVLPGGSTVVSERGRAEITSPQAGGVDRYFGVPLSYGLGVMVDMRWRYGERWGERSFGHVGSSVVGSLVDPTRDLVAAFFFNGRIRSTSLDDSTARFADAADALAEDLGESLV
jgi:CubicO group peptidase (beta-lactamase class C family)